MASRNLSQNHPGPDLSLRSLPARSPVILLAGPTASGKSAVSLELVTRLARDANIHAEIVNADSMQIYRDLQIVSARPSAKEEAQAPHHLYGYVDAGLAYSTADWANDCVRICQTIWARGSLPIIVGGTGLYFKALLSGLATVPDIEPTIRERVRLIQQDQGASGLRAALLGADPIMADRLHANDSQRQARALEVIWSTGESLATFQQQDHKGPFSPLVTGGQVIRLVVTLDRALLYERCDARFDQMLRSGAMEEIQALVARGLSPDLPAMRALGVPQLTQALSGKQTLDAAVEDAKRETRRFAKRQLTWFRNQFDDWDTFDLHHYDKKMRAFENIISKISLINNVK